MYVAFIVSHGDGDAAHLGQVEAGVKLVEVRGDPADPNTGGLLTGEDPHRVEILTEEEESYQRRCRRISPIQPKHLPRRVRRSHGGGAEDNLRIVSVIRNHVFH